MRGAVRVGGRRCGLQQGAGLPPGARRDGGDLRSRRASRPAGLARRSRAACTGGKTWPWAPVNETTGCRNPCHGGKPDQDVPSRGLDPLRDCTRGQLQVDIAHRRVWLWDGEEADAHCWHLIVRREVGSVKTIKYSLSNAPVDTPPLRLCRCKGTVFGSSVPLKMPRASVAWPIIRLWVGGHGTITSPWSCWRCCSLPNSGWPSSPGLNC